MAGFVWSGNTGEKMTPQEVDRKRLAAALMAKQAGDTSPVASPFAGLNRALQGYLSGRDDKRAGAAETAGLARGHAAMSPVLAALSGGGQDSGGGYVPSGTWTPAPPKPSLTATPGASGDLGFGGDVAAMPAAGGGGLAFGAPPMTPQEMIIAGAQARGLDPLDVATAISYETGGRFDPLIKGPTTQWGTHEGLIQFGDPQGDEYGAVFDQGPDVAMQSQLDPENGAVWKYLDKTGVVPGMGLDNIYSAINAGAPGRFNASDANNGGAAGTVAQKVAGMGDHRAKAAQFLGGTWTPADGGQATVSTMGAPVGSNSDILGLLMQAQADPWAAQQYGPVLEALMGSELQTRQQQADPMYQLGLQKSQLELQQMQNPGAPKPIEVGGVLLDPTTYQPIFDSRVQDAPKAGFRMATPEEAKAYGAGAGQFGPDGRFYAADVPQGMTIESDGSGGFRMVQGPAGGDKPLTEAQSKDVVFSTRAQGALDALDPVAGELTNRVARAAEYDPTGLARGAMQSDNFQIAKNAGDEFLQALLRKDSGAAITEGEMALYGSTYLPNPGDNPKLLEQKKAARARAVAAIKAGMNPAQIVAQEKALGVAPSGGDMPALPAGVDAETWGHMTPEEKALFQ